MQFASDNTAGIAPEILAAIAEVNAGFVVGYGDDAVTERVITRLASFFDHEIAGFLVCTGTAANALAVAHLAPPWGAVLCHEECHLIADECGAPEFFGGGLKLVGLAGQGGKIAEATLAAALARDSWGGPHHVSPSVLSLTQPTEAGTIYRLAEIRRLTAIAHGRGMKVHLDGARFANAVARLGCTPAEATWKSGVDAVSFGATKAGALAAEAIVIFDRQAAAGLVERRKRAGHLLSKHRFVAAQFEAFLADELWLKLARHANAMADLLASGLTRAGFAPVWPVEANEVFVVLPAALDQQLRQAGAQYYPWSSSSLPDHVHIGADEVLLRLVTSFATTAAEVEGFTALVQKT